MSGFSKCIYGVLAPVAVAALLIAGVGAAEEPKRIDTKTALIIIDVQEFYFPGGFLPLVAPEAASRNCERVLEKFRDSDGVIVHVGHKVKDQGAFHDHVKPLNGEKVVIKEEVNAFNGTDLTSYLREKGVERLVICGMQTHMCVEGTVRAAYDLGFECILIGDACATKDVNYGSVTVKAVDVHNSTLGSIHKIYGTVVDTETFLKSY